MHLSIDTDNCTSEEIIQKAIADLLEKKRNISAAIAVLNKKLSYIRCLAQEITPQEYAVMKKLPCTSDLYVNSNRTSNPLPIRE